MRTASIAAIAALCLAAATAHADPKVTTLAPTCADVAPEGLDEDSRARTQQVLARTLEQADVLVVDRGCTETYRVAYRDGMVELSGPRTTLREVRKPNVGDQLASLVERERAFRAPVAEPEATTDAKPEATTDATPEANREATTDATPEANDDAEKPDVATAEEPDAGDDSESPAPSTQASAEKNLFYAQLGAGAVAGFDSGHALAIGARVNMGSTDFDISLGTAAARAYGKIELLSAVPAHHTGGYVGGGVSLMSVEGNDHSGAGLGAELSGGVAVSESHRWFVQADISLPFFKVDDIYPATVAISLGYAFAAR